ncbi:MAG: maleate cis-trans isomerase family protein [Gammaproteobacteria bacterium]
MVNQLRRIGLILLSTDLTLEQDLVRIHPGAEAIFHITRVPFENPMTPTNLAALKNELEQATELLIPGCELHAIGFACTSGSAVLGYQSVTDSIHSVRPGIAVTNPVHAGAAGLHALGCQRPAVVAPYPRDVSEKVAEALGGYGLDVPSLTHLNVADDRDVAAIEPSFLMEKVQQAAESDCDSIFIPCTNTPALPIIEALEASIGKAVVSANQGLLWHTLRLAGIPTGLKGFGRLFRYELEVANQ